MYSENLFTISLTLVCALAKCLVFIFKSQCQESFLRLNRSESMTERCSAVQVDRLEKACRQHLVHCALLNKGSHFTTTPLGILILILFLSPPLSPVSFSLPLSVFLLSQNAQYFLFICLPVLTLPLYSRIPES